MNSFTIPEFEDDDSSLSDLPDHNIRHGASGHDWATVKAEAGPGVIWEGNAGAIAKNGLVERGQAEEEGESRGWLALERVNKDKNNERYEVNVSRSNWGNQQPVQPQGMRNTFTDQNNNKESLLVECLLAKISKKTPQNKPSLQTNNQSTTLLTDPPEKDNQLSLKPLQLQQRSYQQPQAQIQIHTFQQSPQSQPQPPGAPTCDPLTWWYTLKINGAYLREILRRISRQIDDNWSLLYDSQEGSSEPVPQNRIAIDLGIEEAEEQCQESKMWQSSRKRDIVCNFVCAFTDYLKKDKPEDITRLTHRQLVCLQAHLNRQVLKRVTQYYQKNQYQGYLTCQQLADIIIDIPIIKCETQQQRKTAITKAIIRTATSKKARRSKQFQFQRLVSTDKSMVVLDDEVISSYGNYYKPEKFMYTAGLKGGLQKVKADKSVRKEKKKDGEAKSKEKKPQSQRKPVRRAASTQVEKSKGPIIIVIDHDDSQEPFLPQPRQQKQPSPNPLKPLNSHSNPLSCPEPGTPVPACPPTPKATHSSFRILQDYSQYTYFLSSDSAMASPESRISAGPYHQLSQQGQPSKRPHIDKIDRYYSPAFQKLMSALKEAVEVGAESGDSNLRIQ